MFISDADLTADSLLRRARDDRQSAPGFRSFIKQVSDQIEPEDTEGLSADVLVSELETLWSWAETEAGRSVRLRRIDCGGEGRLSHRALIECCGPDIPFLVDSLQAELVANGTEILATLHPIVADRAAPRSLIQIHLAPLIDTEAETVLEGVKTTLNDVELAVSDYQEMRTRMQAEARQIASHPHLDPGERDEAYAFLSWLADDHFVFLGSRVYAFKRYDDGNFRSEEPDMVEGLNLGLLRDTSRNVLNAGEEPTVLTPEIGDFLRERQPLIIAKSNLFNRVHRRVLADYVGVKHYDADGRVIGETRFAGLFTSEAYVQAASDVPLIRRKVSRVLERSETLPGSHSGKALATILETYPRDELFQISEGALLSTALGILHLQGRPRTGVFLRTDRFDRFVTALVYVPRENYNAELRARIGAYLERVFDGTITAFYPRFGDEALARVHYTIALTPGHPRPDVEKIRAELVEIARTWEDRFRSTLESADMDADERAAALAFRTAFSAGYREIYEPEEALRDVMQISHLSGSRKVRVRAVAGETINGDRGVLAKVYGRAEPLALSRCVPVMENMGLFVEFETGYPARPNKPPVEGAPDTYWIHAFQMRVANLAPDRMDETLRAFEDCFVAVWTGQTENDAFNRLVFAIGADWHEAALFRALCRYRRQTGLDPAEDVQIRALVNWPEITQNLLALFEARFDPDFEGDLDARRARASALDNEINQQLQDVASLDEDRVLRRLAALIQAIQRTNFFQRETDARVRSAISFKIESQALKALPAPKPFREIFVASPRVEGVHLRFGKIARGGLRWSDRRDDFRTEVLGLVKAQQVKNAVIVPVGAKGGFFPKQLPTGGDREAVRAEGEAAYKIFIRNLLELTDNLDGDTVVHPERTVIWDGEDPYLVVAADKGTASFSDTANAISQSQNFWLDDAFASGGSAGYDHKAMGITARGAWEAVKRHFREMGKDIQSEPFTVIGVGDMSGDVFGNGMLLSKQIRLKAAFNHLHVFIDPDPTDPEKTWEERKRLFEKDRSSWEDYNPDLISDGGGVFSRSAKEIALTDPIRQMTGLTGETTTPDQLIAALLRAECDLLWFGGIGTYVKASDESHGAVGDKGNDLIRADACQLGAKVIGEGANLGITQAGRIEFALRGGRINTDAIDNSAGVDSSDHEVNIKVLLSGAIAAGNLQPDKRNDLLESMTDDVAAHVLAHNYSQTAALSLAAADAERDHEAHERLMQALEARGVLDRQVEGLPDTTAMGDRRDAGNPLTRPELSVLMAWTKITLFDDLVRSGVPDQSFFETVLKDYFPDALDGFEAARDGHRLKREIISTVLANRLVDTIGPAALLRLQEQAGADRAELAAAFALAYELVDAGAVEKDIAALDNIVNSDVQTQMRRELANALIQLTFRFAVDGALQDIAARRRACGDAFEQFHADPDLVSTEFATGRRQARERALTDQAVPEATARRVMALRPIIQAPQVVRLMEETGQPLHRAAQVFTDVGSALSFDRIRVAADEALSDMEFWDRMATRRLIAELMAQQMRMARAAVGSAPEEADDPVAHWLQPMQNERREIETRRQAMAEGGWSFAKFALIAEDIRRFVDHGTGTIAEQG